MQAHGGIDDGHGYNLLSSVERYDEEKDEWEVVADMGSARGFVGVASSFVIDLPHTGADVVASSLDD